MTTTSAEKTIEVLRTLFASYGLPQKLVSDNGPQFTASSFEEFLSANGVQHLKSPPYHLATNGEAERFVQTFKHSLKASHNESGTLAAKLSQFLLKYRTIRHATTGVSPAELFLKRPLRTRLDLLKPSVQEHVSNKQLEQKKHHDVRSKDRFFQVGQPVLVRNFRDGAWLCVCQRGSSDIWSGSQWSIVEAAC